MSEQENVIQTVNLTKFFGNKPSLKKINLQIKKGGVTVLLGRNGAGKTTLLRLILGFEEPTFGQSRILGYNSFKIPPQGRARIGYLTEDHKLYSWMKVDEVVKFQAGFYSHWNGDLCNQTIERFQIDRSTKVKNLSRGQRAGLGLSLVLAPKPELVILDDPSLGLDLVAQRAMVEVLVDLAADPEKTIVLSTHLVDEIERMADHLIVLKNEKIHVACPLETFQQMVGVWSVKLENVPQNWEQLPGLVHSKAMNSTRQLTIVGKPKDCLKSLHEFKFIEPSQIHTNIGQTLGNYLEY